MRIISIDVGIKNLAYCIVESVESVESEESMNKYKILHWDVINLCGEEHMCNCILKEKVKKGKAKAENAKAENAKAKNAKAENAKAENAKAKNAKAEETICDTPPLSLCNKKAVYWKAENYYCQTHAKQSADYFLPNASLKNIKKWKRDALVSYAVTQGIVFPNQCKKDELLSCITTYLSEKTFDKIITVSANEMTLIQMGVQLVKDFDRVLGENNISLLDKIVIENQISPIANRMKTLQGMIAQYFIMRGNPHIAFISSANKLKMFTKAEAEAEAEADSKICKSKTSYSERKKAGVDIVKDLLSHNNATWLPNFLTHKKKDDLADAFLQGVWFLNKNNVKN
jgi:hypothetical protein